MDKWNQERVKERENREQDWELRNKKDVLEQKEFIIKCQPRKLWPHLKLTYSKRIICRVIIVLKKISKI